MHKNTILSNKKTKNTDIQFEWNMQAKQYEYTHEKNLYNFLWFPMWNDLKDILIYNLHTYVFLWILFRLTQDITNSKRTHDRKQNYIQGFKKQRKKNKMNITIILHNVDVQLYTKVTNL